MENKLRSFKLLIIPTISLLLLFIFSCKKDPIGPIIVDTPLVTETIGPDGGTIGTADVSIDIPAGAFNVDNDINISEVTDYSAFGDNSVSKQYKLSGIPNDNNKSIKINIKYTGELNNESFIALGYMQHDLVEGDSTIAYSLNTAIDSSGYLVCELPKNSNNAKLGKVGSSLYEPKNIVLDIFISAITDYDFGRTDHFILQYPFDVGNSIATIGTIFEDVFKIVTKDLGIFYNEEQLPWYIEVYDNGEEFFYANRQNQNIKPTFGVHRGSIIDNEFNKIKISAGKHMIEDEVETLYSGVNKSSYWLDQAVRYWSEELFTDDANYKNPPNFLNYAMEPFNSMELIDNVDLYKHSIGMSSVIKYLTDSEKFGVAGVGKMYQLISNNKNILPVSALLKTMDDLTPDWWPDFFKEYISGNIYNVPFSYFQGNLSGNWSIAGITDTIKVFQANDPQIGHYVDLSAKMFEVTLPNTNIFEEEDNLLFRMDTPSGLHDLALVVFGVKNNIPTYLGTANARDFVVPNLKQYWDDGTKQFLVVLVNSRETSSDYLGYTDINLTVSFKKQKIYNRLLIDYRILNNRHNEQTGISGTTTTWESTGDHQRDEAIFEGSLIEDTFTGSSTVVEDTPTSSRITNYSATVTFNTDKTKIESFAMTSVKKDEWWHTTGDHNDVLDVVKRIGGGNLEKAIYPGSEGTNIFRAVGESTCNYISLVDYSHNWDTSWTSDHGFHYSTNSNAIYTGHSCDDDSFIRIELYSE